MPDITFYYAPGACSLAPHILLHTACLKHHAIPLRATPARTDYPSSFALINPKMKVPVLILDSETITEIPAIATAISALVPDRHFVGRTSMEGVRVYEWMNWLSGTLHGAGFGTVFRPERWSVSGEGLDGIRERGVRVVEECFGVIEGKLGGGGMFVVGGALTVVDAYLFVFYRWGDQLGLEMRGKYPKYAALVENMLELDAVKEALKVENLVYSL